MQPVDGTFIEETVHALIARKLSYAEVAPAIEAAYIRQTLVAYKGNRSRVARKLDMHRNTLSRKMAEYGINLPHRIPSRIPRNLRKSAIRSKRPTRRVDCGVDRGVDRRVDPLPTWASVRAGMREIAAGIGDGA